MSDHTYDNSIKNKLITHRNIIHRGYIKDDKPSACWEYTRYTTQAGYGQILYRGKLWLVHRLSYKFEVDG